MAKAFSVASWNVEYFQNREPQNEARIAFLADQRPDVIAIYEAEGAEVWRELMDAFPRYSFFITEGTNTQEILLGIGPQVTGFVTQKVEFQARDAYMRPGAFLTVRAKDTNYSMLFLHVASMRDPRGFGLRSDMIDKALDFRAVIDKAAGGQANFMFLGHLNAMGLDYVYGKTGQRLDRVEVTAEHEIARLRYEAAKHKMRLLPKTSNFTWRSKGKLRSDLDHVVAAEHLEFKRFGHAEVDVRGWPTLASDADQQKWNADFSDHALLYFEVQAL
jgi:hypothetical protein